MTDELTPEQIEKAKADIQSQQASEQKALADQLAAIQEQLSKLSQPAAPTAEPAKPEPEFDFKAELAKRDEEMKRMKEDYEKKLEGINTRKSVSSQNGQQEEQKMDPKISSEAYRKLSNEEKAAIDKEWFNEKLGGRLN